MGRGSSDDKGPILGWLNVLQYHAENKKELPVNIKFCFEGMEESGSEGLDDLVEREAKAGGWFENVDCVCIVSKPSSTYYDAYPSQSDNYWLNTRTPVLTYGLRGISYFKINVTGPGWDLHSGVFGRTIHEPMTDLVLLMSKLVDVQGNILIPGIDEMVPTAQADERSVYEKLDYAIEDIEAAAGGKITLSSDKVDVLMGRMRSPSLSLHGIEGAFYGAGAKTVIPAKVAGKFSIRFVDSLLSPPAVAHLLAVSSLHKPPRTSYRLSSPTSNPSLPNWAARTLSSSRNSILGSLGSPT